MHRVHVPCCFLSFWFFFQSRSLSFYVIQCGFCSDGMSSAFDTVGKTCKVSSSVVYELRKSLLLNLPLLLYKHLRISAEAIRQLENTLFLITSVMTNQPLCKLALSELIVYTGRR